jgi:hypothetical protein
MPPPPIPIFVRVLCVGVVIGLAVLGWACLFRTERLVLWARRNYERSNRFIRAWPGHSGVMKPWYPAYVRFMGIFVWVFACLLAMGLIYDLAH